jgi:hypothetical protein
VSERGRGSSDRGLPHLALLQLQRSLDGGVRHLSQEEVSERGRGSSDRGLLHLALLQLQRSLDGGVRHLSQEVSERVEGAQTEGCRTSPSPLPGGGE